MKKSVFKYIFFAAVVLYPNVSKAQDSKYQALFIYNFTKYMKWPDKQIITVGVLGKTPIFNDLKTIAERGNQDRLKVTAINQPSEASKCDILYIPESQSKTFKQIRQLITNKNTLIVTERAGLVKEGAEIGFFSENGKLKFAVNKTRLQSTNVMVSQSLYSMAKVI